MKTRLCHPLRLSYQKYHRLTQLQLRLGYCFGSIFSLTGAGIVYEPFGLTFLKKLM